ncbi:MAG: tRNA dihydrouridine synthase DusB [Bacteroidetes bacterium]|nr:tRNA dihydrouridine synthase DusB [Bacteroidota bacterium]
MKIGNIEFDDRPVFLAPMENVTDPSFRVVCKKYGADLMYTEFINSDGLIRGAKKGLAKMEILDFERPVGIQIYGHINESMVEAAKIAEQAGPDLIDINFGCPVRKVVNRGAGSGMMKNVPRMAEMAGQIVKAVKLPVTVKTRLGWDEGSKNIVEAAERLQNAGISALTIHGRTRSQMYAGIADWTLIGEVKNNPRMRIPVIGNGDIESPESAKEAFDKFGVDAVMIGRGSIGCPWIFRHVKHYLLTGKKLPLLSVREKVTIAKEHLALSVERKEERGGVMTMRRHFVQYFKGIPGFRETKIRLLTASSYEANIKILDEIAEVFGVIVV